MKTQLSLSKSTVQQTWMGPALCSVAVTWLRFVPLRLVDIIKSLEQYVSTRNCHTAGHPHIGLEKPSAVVGCVPVLVTPYSGWIYEADPPGSRSSMATLVDSS